MNLKQFGPNNFDDSDYKILLRYFFPRRIIYFLMLILVQWKLPGMDETSTLVLIFTLS